MHMSGKVEETQSARPEVIKYYNKTKGGVDTMEKNAGRVHCETNFAVAIGIFYNMVDVSGLACYVIYREHNARSRAKDQGRKFLRELANMLCMPSIEARSNNRMVVRNHFLPGAVEMVLGRQIVTSPENAAVAHARHGSRGPTPIVGNCCVCQDQKRKQRKTRKNGVICGQPVLRTFNICNDVHP